MLISSKLTGTVVRLRHAIQWFPRRLGRFTQHLLHFCWRDPNWYIESLYLVLDIIALPELYETLADWLKWRTRPLRPKERQLLYPIFGESIDYDRIRVDEGAALGPPQWNICYVSFFTINAWGGMTPSLLIHETVHVWQFQRLGSIYIPRALRAQWSIEGYNYGGAPKLNNWARQQALLTDFNLEQQADIVADYWRLNNGYQPHWGPAGPADLPAYRYFTKQLRSPQQ